MKIILKDLNLWWERNTKVCLEMRYIFPLFNIHFFYPQHRTSHLKSFFLFFFSFQKFQGTKTWLTRNTNTSNLARNLLKVIYFLESLQQSIVHVQDENGHKISIWILSLPNEDTMKNIQSSHGRVISKSFQYVTFVKIKFWKIYTKWIF